jgi:hypothetical protein
LTAQRWGCVMHGHLKLRWLGSSQAKLGDEGKAKNFLKTTVERGASRLGEIVDIRCGAKKPSMHGFVRELETPARTADGADLAGDPCRPIE